MLDNLVHDGLGLGMCDHGGVLKEVSTVWHGTKTLDIGLRIVDGGGIMARSTDRPWGADGKIGWFNSLSFKQALTYARPHVICGVKVRVLLKFKSLCANRANGAQITQDGCLRYKLSKLLVVPASVLPPLVNIY